MPIRTRDGRQPARQSSGGIIGLADRMRYVEERGPENIHEHEMELVTRMRHGVADVEGVRIYFGDNLDNHEGTLLRNAEGVPQADFADILDRDFRIAVLSRLHCAPLVHEDPGLAPARA